LLVALVSAVVGAALLSSPAFAADIAGSDPSGDVKAKGLTAAERAALDVIGVRVVGEPGLGVVVTATFRGNFEQRVGRGHLKNALAALVLVPKPGAGLPAGVVTAGKGPVGAVLERTSSETLGAVRDGRTVTFFVGGPGFENVASVEVHTLAKAAGLAGRAAAGVGGPPEVPDVTWEDLLDSPTEVAGLTADPTVLLCSELRELREVIRDRIDVLLPAVRGSVVASGQVEQLLDLLDVVEAELRSERCSYLFLMGYHFTGTPLALLFYDGGPSVGRIAVMLMYNVLGIVPNSYAGVITSGHDVVVQAPSLEELTGSIMTVDDNPRPGTSAPAPDMSRVPVDLPLPEGLQEIERTFLRDPPTQTGFIFFENDKTGVRTLVSNPELSPTELIPGAAAFQISQAAFEIFPVGPDGHTSLKTEVELPQAPLTPNLDEAAVLLDKATNDETDAIASRTIREMRQLIFNSRNKLDNALRAVASARQAGELDSAHSSKIERQLEEASKSDASAIIDLNNTSLAGDAKKKEARDDVR
ncbi:MAG: hypothetical protein L0206_11800, partial [Actinobacteria bacterium]|nr:hypothetical protein [Actinomycetota bacterium]